LDADEWTVVSRGRQVGTFPERQLTQWAAAGRVDPNDLFWRTGMVNAAPVYTLQPFALYFRSPMPAPTDPSLRWLLPIGRAPWAIVAGYLGLFCILGVFGPLALGAGILGLRQIGRNPALIGRGRAIFGIVAGALATAGMALLLVSH
jgi:hypothetical protein